MNLPSVTPTLFRLTYCLPHAARSVVRTLSASTPAEAGKRAAAMLRDYAASRGVAVQALDYDVTVLA